MTLELEQYYLRQFNFMIKKITLFQRNKICFSDLIADLEALLNVLQTVNDSWKKDFRTYWINLEEVYAFALSEEREYLDKQDVEIIEESLSSIEEMIKEKIKTIK